MLEYNAIRKPTLKIKVGTTFIGGDSKITVQSMTNTNSQDILATMRQVKVLADAGCDIVRLAIPNMESVATIAKIKETYPEIPLVADIHYDYKIAIACADAGIDKIRINPGNIGEESRIQAVVKACRKHSIPIRIGVNSGSVEKHLLEKYQAPTAEALAESALYHVQLLENFDFHEIVVAIKSSDVVTMIRANRIFSEKCAYPLHLGVTEAGTPHTGVIKSSVGIGSLLCDGIGDTIRFSLTADPILEGKEAKIFLQSIGIQSENSIQLVSCPTCGRTKIDLISLVEQFEEASANLSLKRPMKVAIMGCAVNGPGEAREADIGIAGGNQEAVLFKKGVIIRKIAEQEIIRQLIDEIKQMQNEI